MVHPENVRIKDIEGGRLANSLIISFVLLQSMNKVKAMGGENIPFITISLLCYDDITNNRVDNTEMFVSCVCRHTCEVCININSIVLVY